MDIHTPWYLEGFAYVQCKSKQQHFMRGIVCECEKDVLRISFSSGGEDSVPVIIDVFIANEERRKNDWTKKCL